MMTGDALIADLVRAVKLALGKRTPNAAIFEFGRVLVDQGATASLQRHFIAELRRPSPDDRAIQAHSLLLTLALTQLALDVRGGRGAARRALDEVRRSLAGELAPGPLPPDGLMLIARCYTDAECDPGPDLKDAIQLAAAAPSDMDWSPTALAAQFHQMAVTLDHDPVAIHAEMAAITDNAPPEVRAVLASAMATAKIPSVVAASLGFVLDASDAVATDTLIALGLPGSSDGITSQTVDRLVRMRPWLPETRHHQLDSAVRALRKRAVAAAPAKPPSVHRLLATLPDGSGAASIFAATRVGGKFTLNMVLLNAGHGAIDAMVDPGMSRRAIDDRLEDVAESIDIVPVSLAFATRLLAHGLAGSLESASGLPLALLEVVENLGLGHVPPVATTTAMLVTDLLRGLPAERIDDAAGAAAAAASSDWEDRFPCVAAWFEASEAIDTRLGELRGRRARYLAVMDEILPARRDFWAERCAWLAATLREQAQDDRWIDAALVARALADDMELPLIGVMRWIAMITVEAFEQNNPKPRPARRRAPAKIKRG